MEKERGRERKGSEKGGEDGQGGGMGEREIGRRYKVREDRGE